MTNTHVAPIDNRTITRSPDARIAAIVARSRATTRAAIIRNMRNA